MTFDEIKDSLTEKLGEETTAVIGDDLANLMNYDTEMKKNIEALEKANKKLTQDKDMLVQSNGRLLRQIAVENESQLYEPRKEEKEESPKEPLDYRTLFDKNGKFI